MTNPPALIAVVHAGSGHDGGQPIIALLSRKYRLIAMNGYAGRNIAGTLATLRRASSQETLVVEGPFPLSSSGLLAKLGLPPQSATHVLLIVSATSIPSDPRGALLRQIIERNGATAIALTKVDDFDLSAIDVDDFEALGKGPRALVEFLERVTGLPVVYVGTGAQTVIDREAVPAHETLGAGDAARIDDS